MFTLNLFVDEMEIVGDEPQAQRRVSAAAAVVKTLQFILNLFY